MTSVLAPAWANSSATVKDPDKSSYSIFHPTPVELMRDISTDRPDQTESPYTVDAGHLQIELDFLNYTKDRDTSNGGDVRTNVLYLTPVNLKLGLSNRMDLQLMVDPYVYSKTDDRVSGTASKVSGFGDVTTRLKINFWGNDTGTTAFAMMPFVKWPLSASSIRNGKTEGGIIWVLGFELPAGWGAAVMSEVDLVSDSLSGSDEEFVNSITFSHDITEKLSGYIEFFTVTGNAPGFRWQGQLDLGFTYLLTKNMQLDFGSNFGVTKSAPDYQPFAGVSLRF